MIELAFYTRRLWCAVFGHVAEATKVWPSGRPNNSPWLVYHHCKRCGKRWIGPK
jgi:hypothetical protein